MMRAFLREAGLYVQAFRGGLPGLCFGLVWVFIALTGGCHAAG